MFPFLLDQIWLILRMWKTNVLQKVHPHACNNSAAVPETLPNWARVQIGRRLWQAWGKRRGLQRSTVSPWSWSMSFSRQTIQRRLWWHHKLRQWSTFLYMLWTLSASSLTDLSRSWKTCESMTVWTPMEQSDCYSWTHPIIQGQCKTNQIHSTVLWPRVEWWP